jgi:hypothetical protein
MAMKKAHKEMLKGAGVLFAVSVFMKEQYDQWVASASRMLGRS